MHPPILIIHLQFHNYYTWEMKKVTWVIIIIIVVFLFPANPPTIIIALMYNYVILFSICSSCTSCQPHVIIMKREVNTRSSYRNLLDWKEFYCWRGRPVEEEQFGVACVYATHMEWRKHQEISVIYNYVDALVFETQTSVVTSYTRVTRSHKSARRPMAIEPTKRYLVSIHQHFLTPNDSPPAPSSRTSTCLLIVSDKN